MHTGGRSADFPVRSNFRAPLMTSLTRLSDAPLPHPSPSPNETGQDRSPSLPPTPGLLQAETIEHIARRQWNNDLVLAVDLGDRIGDPLPARWVQDGRLLERIAANHSRPGQDRSVGSR